MKKIILMLMLAIILVISGCGGGANSESKSGEESGSESGSMSESDGDRPSDDGPNYGIYKSLLQSYETAFLQYPEPEKTPYEVEYEFVDSDEDAYAIYNLAYAELIDLDGNGILELVLVRVYENDSAYFYHQGDETFEVQVFSLTEDNELYHVGEIPLVTNWEMGDRFVFEKAVVDGVHYLVSGNSYNYFNQESRIYWKMSEFGTLIPEIQFSVEWNPQTQAYDYFYIGGNMVGEDEYFEEYNSWYANVESYVIVGATAEDVVVPKSKLDEALAFLDDYESVSGDFGCATFFEGRFLINEYEPVFRSEEIVIDFFKAQVLKDEAAIRAVTEESYSDGLMAGIAEDRFIPGYIIHSAEQLDSEKYGEETIYMVEDLLTEFYVDESTLVDVSDFEIVRLLVDEVLDFDVSLAAPQVGYDTYRMWAIVGTEDDGESYKVYKVLSDKFYDYLPEHGGDPIQVAFIGSIFETGVAGENPFSDLATFSGTDYILTEEEMNNVTYKNFGGYENYLIRSSWGDSGTLQIYANSVGVNGEDVRGNLLYTFEPNEVLLFSCNQSDLFSDVEVVFTSPTGYQYSYYPFISKMDGSLVYGDYGSPFPTNIGMGW